MMTLVQEIKWQILKSVWRKKEDTETPHYISVTLSTDETTNKKVILSMSWILN